MMNLNLNLLPVEKKNRLEYILNFLLTKDILKVVVIIGSILAATLIWSWVFLEEYFASLAQSAIAINREYYSHSQDVKNINSLVKGINLASQNFVPLTPKLKEIILSLPNDIKINSLRLDREAQEIVIDGTALTRSALLQYQDILNKVTWITQVETPASQLFQKNNIDFEFKAKLKNLSLKNGGSAPKPKPVITDD